MLTERKRKKKRRRKIEKEEEETLFGVMVLCEYFSAGWSAVLLQGRRVLALNTTLTSCVRSQPSLCPCCSDPWLRLFSIAEKMRGNHSNDERTVCMQQNQVFCFFFSKCVSRTEHWHGAGCPCSDTQALNLKKNDVSEDIFEVEAEIILKKLHYNLTPQTCFWTNVITF